jgi:hypothetical protein
MEEKQNTGTQEKVPDIDMQIIMGISRLGEVKNGKLLPERMAALIELGALMRGYQKEFLNNELVLTICEKKIEFILQAETKSNLKEILSPPKVHYNGNEVVPISKYHIVEEELLIWSMTSLWCGGPLNDAGFKRYMKLFSEIYPEMAKEIGIV